MNSVGVLVVANLIPIVGVLLLRWDVATILVLYWVENGVVGLLNVPKILLARGPPNVGIPAMADLQQAVLKVGTPDALRFALAPFFLLHYGMFWLVHGIFVFSLPFVWGGAGPGSAPDLDFPLGALGSLAGQPLELLIAATGLGLSHAASLALNYLGRREYLEVSPFEQMFRPYGRLVVLHVTIILGGLAVAALGQPVGLVLVLVGVKTILDVRFHVREHARAAGQAVAEPSDWLRT